MNFLIHVFLSSLVFCSDAFLTSKIPIIKKAKINNNLKMINPLPGSDIGIPLNIFQNVYTNLHYGYDITTVKNVGLQFLIGYYTYGNDRYLDALDYSKSKFNTTKIELYKYINDNQDFIKSSLDIAFGLTIVTLITDENFLKNIPFILILGSTDYYRDIKKSIGIFKPLYISILWTSCAIFLPCVLHDHDYSIINYPFDYLPCMLTLFGLSNILDLKDIQEDRENGIETIPVKYGAYNSSMISLFCLALSSLIFGLNQNYLDRPIINSINELQNAGMAFVPYLMLKDDFKNVTKI